MEKTSSMPAKAIRSHKIINQEKMNQLGGPHDTEFFKVFEFYLDRAIKAIKKQ